MKTQISKDQVINLDHNNSLVISNNRGVVTESKVIKYVKSVGLRLTKSQQISILVFERFIDKCITAIDHPYNTNIGFKNASYLDIIRICIHEPEITFTLCDQRVPHEVLREYLTFIISLRLDYRKLTDYYTLGHILSFKLEITRNTSFNDIKLMLENL